MSNKLQLEVFEKFIAVPGCTLSRTGLQIEQPTEENFRAAFGFLQTVEGCSAWWWGDLIAAHAAWDAKQGRTKAGRYAETYDAARWAAMIDREEATVRSWVRIALFYEHGARNTGLSWAHHLEAAAGADGDVATAQGWLDKAENNGWSKTQLRAAIRLQARAETEPDEPLPSSRMQEVTSFNRWARAQLNRVQDMDPKWRQQLLAELEPAEKLIAALHSVDGVVDVAAAVAA